MTVIPFDPERGRPTRIPAQTREAHGMLLDGPGRLPAKGADVPPLSNGEPPETENLADALSRIERLERALLATLKENATNWARAERAERTKGRPEP